LRTNGLKVNAKTKYVVMSRDQHAVQNHNIMIGNKSFERVEQLRYLGTTITKVAFMKKLRADWMQGMLATIRYRIFCFPVCYPSIKIKIFRAVILPVVLHGCETWSLTLREARRLRMLENRVLRKIFGPERDEVTGEWRRLHKEEFYDLCFSPNIIRVIK